MSYLIDLRCVWLTAPRGCNMLLGRGQDIAIPIHAIRTRMSPRLAHTGYTVCHDVDAQSHFSVSLLLGLSQHVVPIVLTRRIPLFYFAVLPETTNVRYGRRGTGNSGKLGALPGHVAIAITANTATSTTRARAATPDIPGLVHAQHTALLVLPHLTL